ncbi:MAG TPA: hypothetical protein VEB03_00470 [Candidatus Nanoarchaeia archaeon]|nr:hypothetical protein [Candidatus Nanoarchaeia archaeon]
MTNHFADHHQFVHNGDITHHSVNGEHVSTAFKNTFGGHDYFDNHNHMFESTTKNVFGGKDVMHNGQLQERSMPNVHGGHDVYDGNMQLKVSTLKNVHGGHDALSHGKLVSTSIPTGHGTSSVFHWGAGNTDPLAHVGEYVMSKLVL